MLIHGKNRPSIAILGVGAIGGFLAALFYKNGYDVTGISRKSCDEILIESKSLGNFKANPKIVLEQNKKCDVLFIAVKSYDLEDSLCRIKTQFIKGAVIIPLLNGLEHVDILRKDFGKNVIAASIGNIEVKRSSQNTILHTTKSGTIWISKHNQSIQKLIKSIGLQVEICESDAHVLWSKLVRLSALACATAASGRAIGFIRSDKIWRQKLLDCLKEATLVAQHEGVIIDIKSNIEKIDSMPEDLSTSLARDVAAKRPNESDAIAGSIIRLGSKYGITCPTIQEMLGMIRGKA